MRFLFLAFAVSAAATGCGGREDAAGGGGEQVSVKRDRNAELPGFTLVNGVFASGEGGWSVDGLAVGSGCAGSIGSPSLGVWQKNALTFGYQPTTVTQSVRIAEPSTLVLTVTAAVRADQPNASFSVSLATPSQSATTGSQSGSALVKPTVFELRAKTTEPNETVVVSISGASEKYWAGCYGPIISNVSLATTPDVPSSSTTTISVGSTTTIATGSTTATPTSIAASPTSTVASSTTTTIKSTVQQVSKSTTERTCELVKNGVCRGSAILEGMKPPLGQSLRGLQASGTNFGDFVWRNDFSESNLHHANFSGAVLWNSNFERSVLVGADMSGVSLDDVPSVYAPSSKPKGSTNFASANLAHSNWSDSMMVQGIFKSANLVGASLDNAVLSGSDFSGANLSGASLVDARTAGIVGDNFRLPDGYHAVKEVKGSSKYGHVETSAIVGPLVDLSEPELAEWVGDSAATFSSVTTPSTRSIEYWSCKAQADRALRSSAEAIKRRSSLEGVSFVDKDLTGVDFAGLNLKGANFSGADLTGVSFKGANLSEVKFSRATLDNVDFSGANVSGVDFKQVRLFRNIASACTYVDSGRNVSLPAKWKFDQSVATFAVEASSNGQSGFGSYIVNHGLFLGPTAVLVEVNVNGLNLSSLDMSSAQFVSTSSISVDCKPIRPVTGKTDGLKLPVDHGFVGAAFIGPSVDLCRANLSNVDLRTFNLENSNLDGISTFGLRGAPTLPVGWTLAKGVLVGPLVSIQNVNFGDVDLSNVMMFGARFDGVDFSRAKLSGVSSLGISGTARWPKGYGVHGGYLLGPDVNLSGASLSPATGPKTSFDLTGFDLTGIDLSGAVLDRVNMSGVFGTPKLPSGWKIVGSRPKSVLLGPGADPKAFYSAGPNPDLRGVELPQGYVIAADRLIGQGMEPGSVSGVVGPIDLSGSILTKNAFASATLVGVRGDGVSQGVKAIPAEGLPLAPGWEITPGGVIVGPSANLSELDLEGDSISIGDLSAANLDHVRAVRTRFVQAKSLKLPAGWRYSSGMLFGPTANLAGADLSDVEFRNDDLSGAELEGAYGSGITGSAKLPEGWAIRDGYLIGPEADILCTPFRWSDLDRGQYGRFSAYFDPDKFGLTKIDEPYCR